MPSTSLHSRISAFETLAGPSTSHSSQKPIPRRLAKSPPINSLLETPLSPAAASLPAIIPFTPPRAVSRSPSPSPPNLGRKTSLIDLKDWIVDDGPSSPRSNGYTPKSRATNENGNFDFSRTPTQRVFDVRKPYSNTTTPLINLAPPPKPRMSDANGAKSKAPPLPPRKPSLTSLKSATSTTSRKYNYTATPSLQPPRRADSLEVEHTYPPLKLDTDSRKAGSGHAPASSISSFHSVSLSSDTDPSTPGSITSFIATFPMDREYSATSNGNEADTISLGESYEDVSTSSLASPAMEAMITLDWERAMSKRKLMPPKLPQRPSTTSPKPSSIKGPPPPPPLLRPSKSTDVPQSAPTSPKILAPSLSSSPSPSTPATRRAPPRPPPSRPSHASTSTAPSGSDRSSMQSFTSNSTHITYTRKSPTKSTLTRPTPVPDTARKRYASVFNSNVLQRRKAQKLQAQSKPALLSAKKTRQAAGWRGLSVDLITNPINGGDGVVKSEKGEEGWDGGEESVGPEERLEGHVVRLIWSRSRLDTGKLGDIWCVYISISLHPCCVFLPTIPPVS